MELKYLDHLAEKVLREGFNRTFMELKFGR